MINTDQIKQKYPKAYKKCLSWFRGLLNEMFLSKIELNETNIEEVFKKHLQGNTRVLYNFFDSEDVILSVCRNSNERFYYFINEEDYTETYETRPLAEEKGFESCFSVLEILL